MPRNRSEKAPPAPTWDDIPEAILAILRLDAQDAIHKGHLPEAVRGTSLCWNSLAGDTLHGRLSDADTAYYDSQLDCYKASNFIAAHMEYLLATQPK